MLAVGGGPGCPKELSEFPEVFAVFGPTASGKSEVADALAGRLATEVVSADALQVYRGLPILTNQPASPTRLVAIRELAEEMSVGEYARLAHEAIDELVGANGAAVVAGGTGLYLRAALADMRLPPLLRPGRATAGTRPTTRPAATYARWQRSIRGRRPSCTRATAAESSERSSSPSSARRSRPRAIGCGRRGPAGRRSSPGSTSRSSPSRRGSRNARRRCSRRGVVDGCAPRSRRHLRTAEKALGLRELAVLPADEALQRLIVRTRRYAAYQRKWMRRIPASS